jgi:Na+-transporting NADH:ubiquinone oxidoreductase subunit D
MANSKMKEVFTAPINVLNPVLVQVLGICSALAVTSQLKPALVMLVVVAALVTIVSQILKAFAYDVSVQLSVYVGLIITNCILMGRLEAFAMQNGPVQSLIDGFANGLGYGLILVIVGAFRELLGRGSLLGYQIIPEGAYDFGYINNGMMTMPAMALIMIGVVIWIHRAYFYKEEK